MIVLMNFSIEKNLELILKVELECCISICDLYKKNHLYYINFIFFDYDSIGLSRVIRRIDLFYFVYFYSNCLNAIPFHLSDHNCLLLLARA